MARQGSAQGELGSQWFVIRGLIKKTKKPKRDTRGSSNLNAVYGEERAWFVFDLLKGLAGAANLKEEFAVNKEIAAFGVGRLSHGLYLIVEESLPHGSLVRPASENVHEI